jgi:retron-type reverse transcriptase
MISQTELLKAYQKFVKGKNKKIDVQQFMLNFEEELVILWRDVNSGSYRHGKYEHFRVFDPKLREIDKASVRDRIVHQLVYDYLVKIFDRTFYFYSFAARKGKGTHQAIKVFRKMFLHANRNFRNPVFVLKCDIEKFFASIDRKILFLLIARKIKNEQYIFLIKQIVESFYRGIPLGNLTSQIFANIYLNELDRFVKHHLKIKRYIRYMDDFVILGKDRNELLGITEKINHFLKIELKVNLHPRKIIIRKLVQGVDFLGYVVFPYHSILRTKTRKRLLRRIEARQKDCQLGKVSFTKFAQTINSYFGILKHCSSFKLRRKILSLVGEEVS